MSARDDILAAVRASRPPGDFPRPELPRFPRPEEDALVAFQRSLAVMGGQWLQPAESEDLAAVIRGRAAPGALIRSATAELPEFPRVDDVNRPQDLENVDIAVVRARFGVAETGSVFLSDHELQVNTIAYLAQHLIVLLDPAAIVPGIADAYLRPDFSEARYVSLMTGPSATADIEGVMIRGAQGVRSLTVVFAAPAT
jgi:L-lactate dehydrogenase complex protein LldG